MKHDLYVLAGATATGKTSVAHVLARMLDAAILSADAMLIYQGMDIGTAKPTPAERAGLTYGGLDCVTPDQSFSVGQYRDVALAFLRSLPDQQPVVVVGGTGLYIKSLLAGLDPMPPVDPAVRREVDRVYEQGGVAALQAACQAEAPERYASLKDPANPRRLSRVLELARMGVPAQSAWQRTMKGRCAILQRERAQLHQRIERRVEDMYAHGLVAEVESLLQRWPNWSKTAAMAIGYREARARLAGELSEAKAKAETARRTRHYARRQQTWFRHQLPQDTIAVVETDTPDDIAARVAQSWRTHGPCELAN